MERVVIVTGGGSGMGKAAISFLDPAKRIVISGRHLDKLQKTADEMAEKGHSVVPFVCDTSDRGSVKELAAFAAGLGEITNVIQCAGVSPAMAEPEQIVRINAMGTVYVNQELSRVMKPGSVICDVASNSAYQLPRFLIRPGLYALAEENEALFVRKVLSMAHLARGDYQRAGFAYAISKNFVTWFASRCAFRYGPRGIRVCSVSPGLIDTGMGKMECAANGAGLFSHTAEGRPGKPEELGFAIAMAADERNGYLAGVDILADGGEIAGRKFRR